MITHRPHSGLEEATELSYSYLGGGITYDPPNTYGMVSKRMPLAMADTFLAVVLFLSGGKVDRQFFIRTTQAQIRHAVTRNEAANETDERVRGVRQRLENLQRDYETPLRLLSHCGINVHLVVSQHVLDQLSARRPREQ